MLLLSFKPQKLSWRGSGNTLTALLTESCLEVRIFFISLGEEGKRRDIGINFLKLILIKLRALLF